MIERYNRPLPEYSHTMYEDYEPWEVLAAAHKKILAVAAQRQQEPQPVPIEDFNINIQSEVKVKK